MTKDMVKSGARSLAATFGGMVAGFFAAKGWLTADQVMAIINSEAFIGVVASAVMFVLSLIARRQKNMVATVAAMPEVLRVTTTATTEGKALADAAGSTPEAVVVVAR